MHLLLQKDAALNLAVNSIELGQAVFYVPQKQDDSQNAESASDKKKPPFNKMLNKIFPYLNTTTIYNLHDSSGGINSIIKICALSESGKINLNSLYDIKAKKFFKEGQAGDRKKICEWLFENIAKITKKPSLFTSFEQHLKKRDTEFNDVTELFSIPDFADVFKQKMFLTNPENPLQMVYLTDIFTVVTNEETINPWFLSPSWQMILGIKSKQLSKEEEKKLVESFKNKVNWEVDWNTSLQIIYQKEYKDLPKEIKSLLTTECEANIFSLLLSATIGETEVTIFTILKKQATEKSLPFDIIKIYQI